MAHEHPPASGPILASSPQVLGPESVPRIMWAVVIALTPACLAAVWFFGVKALVVIGVSSAVAVAVEAAILRARGDAPARAWRRALDGSALITGLLLALNLPANSPAWLVALGAAFAVAIGKHAFGGLGNNVFNPALVGRVFLLMSFPAHLSTWMATPEPGSPRWAAPYESMESLTGKVEGIEAGTAATPLGLVKTERTREGGVARTLEAFPDLRALVVGKRAGSLGETSVLALLLGAAFLFWRRILTWHIPLSFVLATFAVTGVMYAIDPTTHLSPLYHVLAGGLVIGALFMATDMVTSPVTPRGMIVFGAGCGLLTAVIRLWGSFPEGVSFAILIMNGLVPLIDAKILPRRFGSGTKVAG